MSDTTENIIYISVPADFATTIGDFQINPDIMLPVEVAGPAESYDVQDLSWEQIIAAMLKILAHEPGHDDADYFRDFVRAVRPEIVDELTQTAILKARNDDFDIAREIFLALVGLQPGAQRPLINLALLYEQKSDRAATAGNDAVAQAEAERAFEVYREIMSGENILPEAHLNAGHFYLKQKNFASARDHLHAFVEESEDSEQKEDAQRIIREIESQNLLDNMFKEAYDFIRMGKEQEGIERAREFLQSYPDVWNGWFLLGWGLRRLERYEDASLAFEKALETGPRQTDTLNELAICAMELDDLSKARALLVEALSDEPENTKIISNLGIVELKSENSTEARAYFRAVLEISPDDQLATTYLQQLDEQ
jgi:tetratricopeptide (TPR) repeat protein